MRSRKLKSSHLKTVLFVRQPVSSKVTFTNLALFLFKHSCLSKKKKFWEEESPSQSTDYNLLHHQEQIFSLCALSLMQC